MKRQRKKYERPSKPLDKQRIEREREIIKTFGLKTKKEIWRTEALLRKYRRLAREMIVKKDKTKESAMIEKLVKVGLLDKNATLDDVLGLNLEKFLERRLQTVVFKKGLANSMKDARQAIVHGKILIGDKRVVYPSYLVSNEENNIIKRSNFESKPSADIEQTEIGKEEKSNLPA